MRKTLIFIRVLLGLICSAQNNDFVQIAKVVKRISPAQEKSTASISNYIKANFRNREEQLKAAFYWTATNIDYAVEDM